MTTTRRYALLALGAAMAPALTIAAPLEQEYISKTGWCPSPLMPGPSIQLEHRQWHMIGFAPAVAGKEFVEFHREFIAQLDDFRLYGRDTAVGGDTGDPDFAIVPVLAQPFSQLKGPHLNLNGYNRPGPLDVTVDGLRSTPWVPRPANLRLGNAAFQAFTDNGVGAALDGLFHGNGHMTIATHDQMAGPWFGDMGNTLDATRDSEFFQWHKNIDNIYGDWAVGQYWPTPANPTRSPIYFSVIGAGVGRGGSSLNFRRQADVYLGNNPPVGIPTTQYGARPRIASDIYVGDRNRFNLLYHYGIRQWNETPSPLTNAWDVDAWTILNPPGNGWYFSVTPGSVGLAGTAVAAQAVRGGDVFESAGGGTNTLFRTEDELGLLAAASDNLDALEVDQQRRVQATNDRARPGIADRTKQWFSLRSGSTFSLEALGPLTVSNNDILQFNANGDLVRAVAAAVLGLGAAGNELDALVIVDTAPLDTLNATDRIYYSLAAGSPALAGNCPSDIFCHTVAGVACGALGGRLEMTAASLGLACTDDLDALDIRRNPTGLGACCHANGSCTEVTPANCTAAGDIFWGLETVCSAAECASDLGACCHANGTCTFVSDTACLAANGVFRGAGIACASVQCPSAPGNNDCDYGYEIPYDYPDQYQPSGYYEPPPEYTDNTYATTYDPLCDDPPYSCADHETFFPEYGSGSIWYYYDVPPTYPRGGPGEQLLYEQPVDPTDNGVGPGSLLAIGSSCPFNNTSAEDFTLTNSASITRVTWEGVYFGNAPDFPGMDVNFHITVYADNGAGNVGAVVADYPTNMVMMKTPSTRPPVFGSNPVYAYSADLSPPLQATAGQRYWLSINGNPSGSAGPTWGWMVSQVGNAASLPGNDQPLQNVSTPCAGLPAASYTPGGSDGTQDADLAFGLYGGAGGYDTRSIGFYTRNTYDSYEQGGDYAADTRLAIYYAPYGDCSYLQEVACGDNSYDTYNPPNPPYGGYGYVEYYNPPPGRYYIQVGTVGDANRGQIYLQIRDPGSAACCYPDGTCAVVDTRACEDGGGEPQAAGSSCMGDNDGNGLDDLCQDDPCADCGPGSHWIDNPACPPGTDHIPTAAYVGVDTNLDGQADTFVYTSGPSGVRRTGPLDDSAQFPGTRPTDGHLDVIDTEMVFLNLTQPGGGGVSLIAGAGRGTIPLAASLGNMAEQPTNPALAGSFFDVFFEMDLGGGNKLYNQTPCKVTAVVDCIPPRTIYAYDPSGPPLPLYTSPIPGQGVHVANMTSAYHFTHPQPQACCNADGTCTNNVDPAACVAAGGEPQAVGTSCMGDNNSNGIDDLCEDQPCADCGPGPHWIHAPAPCPAGTNHIPTTAVVGLDTNNDGVADTTLNLSGPTTVQHNVASDDSSNFPGTAPVDGHVDVIDYEMTYMNLTGGGATIIAGVGLGSIPLDASLGAMREQVGNPALADGFFDIFFEFDLGGGNRLYNHTPLRINAPNLDCFAPILLGLNPPGLVPLFTSPTGGSQVANLVTARHTTFPPPLEACCYPDGTCADNVDPAVCINTTPGSLKRFVIPMSGAQEVAPTVGDPDGTGTAYLTIDDSTSPPTISWNIVANNIEPTISGAHIHQGVAGTNGPVRVDFSAQLSGSGLQDPDLVSVLANPAGWYVNVHTQPSHAGGAIRGQMNAPVGGGEPQGPGSQCQGDADGNGLDDLCQDDPCDDCGPGPHWIHAPAPCPAGTNHIPTTAVVGLDTNNDGVADTTLNLAGPTTVQHNVASDDSSNFPGTAPVDGHVDVIDYEMTYMNLTGGGATIIAGVGLGSIPLDASLGAMREQVGNPALADGFFDIFFEFDLGGGNRLYNHTPLRINAPDLTCFAPVLLGFNPPGLVPLFTSPTGGVQVANLVTARHTTFPTGIPGATVTSAVSRRNNPHAPGLCDTNLLPPRKSEPHQGGVQQVRIGFDVAPATPVGSGITVEQATCAAPAFVPYTGAAVASSSVASNELVVTFTPGLENGRSYRLNIGGTVTSISGQNVIVRGLLGDVNSDGFVNATDRSVVVGTWTAVGSFGCPTDVNSDGSTNATDRSLVVGAWTGGPATNCAP